MPPGVRPVPGVFALVALALVAGGIALLATAGRTLLRARHSRAWPIIPAVTTQAARHPVGLMHAMGGGTAWEVTVRYRFHLAEVTHEGDRLCHSVWRFGGHSPRIAQALVEAHRPGTPITIRVNPDNPRDSVVDPRVDQAAIGSMILLGALFLASGVWLLLAPLGWVQL